MSIMLDKLVSFLSSVTNGLEAATHLVADYLKGFSDTIASNNKAGDFMAIYPTHIHDNTSIGIDHSGEWDTNMYNMGVYTAHFIKIAQKVDKVIHVTKSSEHDYATLAGCISLANEIFHH